MGRVASVLSVRAAIAPQHSSRLFAVLSSHLGCSPVPTPGARAVKALGVGGLKHAQTLADLKFERCL